MRQRTGGIDWLALTLDAAVLALLLAAYLIFQTGGGIFSLGPVRVRAHSLWRPLLVAALIGVVRIVFRRCSSPFGGLLARVIALYRPLESDLRRPAETPVRRSMWQRLWPLGGILLAAAVLLRHQLLNLDSVPDLGDPVFSMWRLSWIAHQIVTDPLHLFDANIFFPAELALTYSDSIILPGLVAAPFLWAGVPPLYVYNVMFVSTFVLSGVAMFYLCRELTGHSLGAYVGALIFAFYPFRFEHYSHLELQITFWFPLALLALKRVLATGRLRSGVVLGLVLAGQAWSCMYFGLMLPLYVGVAACVLFVGWGRRWARLKGLAVAVPVFVALGGPVALPYLGSRAERGDRDVAEALHYSAAPGDYLEAHQRSVVYGRLLFHDNYKPERQLFPGLGAVTLAAAALWPPLSVPRVAGLVGLGAAFDASLGFRGYSFPFLYDMLPPFRGLRALARFSIFVGFSLALLAAYGARRLITASARPQARAVIGAALVAVVLVDLSPRLELEPVWPTMPPVYSSVGPDDVLVEFPVPTPDESWRNLPYMYFSTSHWARLVNGYSGSSPRETDRVAELLSTFPAPRAVTTLRALRPTHVTVNCALFARGDCQTVLDHLDRDPGMTPVARARWQGATVALYRVSAEESR